MSILLESLNQSKPSTGNSPDSGVPSVDDSHFDDEMLSDEWLLKKLQFWKIISAILLTALLVSWTVFYFYSSNTAKMVDQSVSEAENKEPSKTEADVSKVIVDQMSNDEEVKATNKPEIISSLTKEKYQPKKMEENNVLTPAEKNNSTVPVEKKLGGGSSWKKDIKTSEPVIEFDSLNEMEKQELPELEISSYAVSSNPAKSFVVLNGAFYGQGETIAPFLILISINKNGILLKYKGRMISKKYSL